MPPLSQQHDPIAALRILEFRDLIIGRFLYIMGLRMMTTLLAWWVYTLTNDPLAIGLIGLSEVIPALSLALYAGHVIDISEKRKLLLIGTISFVGCATALWGISTINPGTDLPVHWITVCIYGIVFLTGILRSFTGPVFHTMIGAIVPREKIQNATTLNQGSWLTASVTGHAAGGFLIAHLGISNTWLVIIGLMVAGITFLWRLSKKPPMLREGGPVNAWASMSQGLRFVLHTKEVLGAMLLDMFAVLFGGAVAMIPVFAKDILKAGPEGFGLLNAAPDIGSATIVIILTLFPMRRHQGRKLLLAVAGFGLCIITFGLSNLYWLSFLALLTSGLLDGISVVVRGTILQLKTPEEMRGRVMSVNSMFINSSNELGQFESGVMAKLLGVVPSVVFGGIVTLGVAVVTWYKAPTLRKMEY